MHNPNRRSASHIGKKQLQDYLTEIIHARELLTHLLYTETTDRISTARDSIISYDNNLSLLDRYLTTSGLEEYNKTVQINLKEAVCKELIFGFSFMNIYNEEFLKSEHFLKNDQPLLEFQQKIKVLEIELNKAKVDTTCVPKRLQFANKVKLPSMLQEKLSDTKIGYHDSTDKKGGNLGLVGTDSKTMSYSLISDEKNQQRCGDLGEKDYNSEDDYDKKVDLLKTDQSYLKKDLQKQTNNVLQKDDIFEQKVEMMELKKSIDSLTQQYLYKEQLQSSSDKKDQNKPSSENDDNSDIFLTKHDFHEHKVELMMLKKDQEQIHQQFLQKDDFYECRDDLMKMKLDFSHDDFKAKLLSLHDEVAVLATQNLKTEQNSEQILTELEQFKKGSVSNQKPIAHDNVTSTIAGISNNSSENLMNEIQKQNKRLDGYVHKGDLRTYANPELIKSSLEETNEYIALQSTMNSYEISATDAYVNEMKNELIQTFRDEISQLKGDNYSQNRRLNKLEEINENPESNNFMKNQIKNINDELKAKLESEQTTVRKKLHGVDQNLRGLGQTLSSRVNKDIEKMKSQIDTLESEIVKNYYMQDLTNTANMINSENDSHLEMTNSLKNEIYALNRQVQKLENAQQSGGDYIQIQKQLKDIEISFSKKLENELDIIRKKLGRVDLNLRGVGQTLNSRVSKEIDRLKGNIDTLESEVVKNDYLMHLNMISMENILEQNSSKDEDIVELRSMNYSIQRRFEKLEDGGGGNGNLEQQVNGLNTKLDNELNRVQKKQSGMDLNLRGIGQTLNSRVNKEMEKIKSNIEGIESEVVKNDYQTHLNMIATGEIQNQAYDKAEEISELRSNNYTLQRRLEKIEERNEMTGDAALVEKKMKDVEISIMKKVESNLYTINKKQTGFDLNLRGIGQTLNSRVNKEFDKLKSCISDLEEEQVTSDYMSYLNNVAVHEIQMEAADKTEEIADLRSNNYAMQRRLEKFEDQKENGGDQALVNNKLKTLENQLINKLDSWAHTFNKKTNGFDLNLRGIAQTLNSRVNKEIEKLKSNINEIEEEFVKSDYINSQENLAGHINDNQEFLDIVEDVKSSQKIEFNNLTKKIDYCFYQSKNMKNLILELFDDYMKKKDSQNISKTDYDYIANQKDYKIKTCNDDNGCTTGEIGEQDIQSRLDNIEIIVKENMRKIDSINNKLEEIGGCSLLGADTKGSMLKNEMSPNILTKDQLREKEEAGGMSYISHVRSKGDEYSFSIKNKDKGPIEKADITERVDYLEKEFEKMNEESLMKYQSKQQIDELRNELNRSKDEINAWLTRISKSRSREKEQVVYHNIIEEPSEAKFDVSRSQISFENDQIVTNQQKDVTRMTSFVNDIGNKQALECIEKMKDNEISLDDKMDSLEWMVKNIRFISDNLTSTIIKLCQDMHKKGRSSKEYNILFKTKHNSPINSTLKKVLAEAIANREHESYTRCLHNQMDLLEIQLFSEFNLERCATLEVHVQLLGVIVEDTSNKIIRLQAQRNLALMFRKASVVRLTIKNVSFANILAYCAKDYKGSPHSIMFKLKMLSLALTLPDICDFIIRLNNDIPVQLIDIIEITRNNREALGDNLSVIKHYSENVALLDYFKPVDKVIILVELYKEVKSSRLKKELGLIMKNLNAHAEISSLLHKTDAFKLFADSL